VPLPDRERPEPYQNARESKTRRTAVIIESALEVLRENPLRSHSFPVDGFCWNAAFALIADAQGLRGPAIKSAAKALQFAQSSRTSRACSRDIIVKLPNTTMQATTRLPHTEC